MGETYHLVAPERREFYQICGKLGAFFFHQGPFRGLVDLLTVPMTVSMTNPNKTGKDKEEEEEASGNKDSIATTADQERGSLEAGSKRKATSPPPSHCHRLQKRINHEEKPNSDETTLTGFNKLPVELLHTVLDNIEYIEDVVRLGLVNKRLFDVCTNTVAEFCRQPIGIWANTPIACAGEYSQPDDFPDELFSAEKRDRLYRGKIDDNDDDDDSGCPITLFDFARPTFANHVEFYGLQSTIKYIEREVLKPLPSSEALGRDRMRELMSSQEHNQQLLPENEPWVLRNLTTKEIVHAEAIAKNPEFSNGRHIEGYGFASIIFMRICWSPEGIMRDYGGPNPARGVWAGHRFDIVTLAHHRRETGAGADWTDVSEEVAKEARKMDASM